MPKGGAGIDALVKVERPDTKPGGVGGRRHRSDR
jgi:hypothetical protein